MFERSLYVLKNTIVAESTLWMLSYIFSMLSGSIKVTQMVTHVLVARSTILKCVDRDLRCITSFYVDRVLVFLFRSGVGNVSGYLLLIWTCLSWKRIHIIELCISVGASTFASDYALYRILRQGLYKVMFVGTFRDGVRFVWGFCGMHMSRCEAHTTDG